MPFPGKSASEIVTRARGGDINLSLKAHRSTSELAKDLVRGLLNVDGRQRLTARQALMHSWFNVDDDDE